MEKDIVTEDIIKIKSDIELRDKDGNIIIIETPKSEYIETWV